MKKAYFPCLVLQVSLEQQERRREEKGGGREERTCLAHYKLASEGVLLNWLSFIKLETSIDLSTGVAGPIG